MKPRLALIGILVWCSALWAMGMFEAAQAQAPRTRDVIRKRIQKIAQASKPEDKQQLASAIGLPDIEGGVVALEYTVLLAKDGQSTPVLDADTHEFHVGDQIRVQIQPLVDVFIYIFHEGASGRRTCLLPESQEEPPLAKAGEKLELPNDDTIFEFTEPAGSEKIIVVAALTPDKDLAALASVVFKKDESELTPEERHLKKELAGTSERILKSISEKKNKTARHRGLINDRTLAQFAAGKSKTRAVIEEPPSGQETSTFAMAANSASGGKAELYLSIPLKSISIQSKGE